MKWKIQILGTFKSWVKFSVFDVFLLDMKYLKLFWNAFQTLYFLSYSAEFGGSCYSPVTYRYDKKDCDSSPNVSLRETSHQKGIISWSQYLWQSNLERMIDKNVWKCFFWCFFRYLFMTNCMSNSLESNERYNQSYKC
jgi:hypothetical protein